MKHEMGRYSFNEELILLIDFLILDCIQPSQKG